MRTTLLFCPHLTMDFASTYGDLGSFLQTRADGLPLQQYLIILISVSRYPLSNVNLGLGKVLYLKIYVYSFSMQV